VRVGRLIAGVLVLVLVVGAGFAVIAWRSEIEPEEPPERAAFDDELIAKGAQLAAVGNCIACHTVPGSEAFAGGLPVPTPFGTIYSTNISPEPETGIGRWSEAAFQRAMREGVDRQGNHLYPAFPYENYTRVTEEDNRALYAYLMTRQPVRATAPENALPFPLNVRPLLAAWKLLFFDEGVYQPEPRAGEEWNRGAYLAEGLGHCGACHTPRNALGALESDRHFAGGESEGWQAYAIDGSSPAPIPWDRDSLAFYLRHGWHAAHGVSRGPMAEVTGNLDPLPNADIDAIATYVASVMGEPSPERRRQADALLEEVARGPDHAVAASDSQTSPTSDGPQDAGAAIYAAACASCHDAGRPLPFGALDFALSTAVNAANPQNIVNVTLYGLPPADGEASPVMPDFVGVLDDDQMAALLDFMRDRFTDRPRWTDLAELVRRTRTREHEVSIRPADGIERAPANVGAED
jgi:mono/diheme cytochrome c family protein